MVLRILKAAIAFLFLVFSFQISYSQDTLRVMTYNILRYGAAGVGGCTPIGVTARNNWFTDVMSTTQPDIFGINEIGPIDNAVSPATNIALNVLPNVPNKGPFYESTQINFDGNQDICNMMYYNSQKVGLSTQYFIPVNGNVRNLDYYKFYYKSAEPIVDSAFIHVIQVHFMAGSAAGRELQANAAMNYLDNNVGGGQGNYIIMGDMNMDSPNAQAFQNMSAHSNANIRMHDPLNLNSWNTNWAYTQSTTTSTGDCRAGGGLNDRFDLIICSNALINNTLGMSYVPGSHWVVGNPHSPNPSINTATQIGINGMSDHHPVLMDIAVSQAVATDPFHNSPVSLDVSSPFEGTLVGKITVPEGFDGEYRLRVIDLQGRAMAEEIRSLSIGTHAIEMELETLSAGIYFLELSPESLQLATPSSRPILAKIVRMR